MMVELTDSVQPQAYLDALQRLATQLHVARVRIVIVSKQEYPLVTNLDSAEAELDDASRQRDNRCNATGSETPHHAVVRTKPRTWTSMSTVRRGRETRHHAARTAAHWSLHLIVIAGTEKAERASRLVRTNHKTSPDP